MVCLGNELRAFCHFWNCNQVVYFGSFCWLWGYSISSKRFLPTAVDTIVIWVKFTHTKNIDVYSAISCLTTSNLPWFMDLTFQVPMQYCSLQHRTLLPSWALASPWSKPYSPHRRPPEPPLPCQIGTSLQAVILDTESIHLACIPSFSDHSSWLPGGQYFESHDFIYLVWIYSC